MNEPHREPQRGPPVIYNKEVPTIYRLWLPASVLIIGAVISYLANLLRVFGHSSTSQDLNAVINSEFGLIEIATAMTLVVAIFHGTQLLGPTRAFYQRLLFPWVVFNLLGATYFLGEEVSWGQHLFEWSTGEWFYEQNDQRETNLHNISSWLDQKPRTLLFVWCVAGGLVVPLWYRVRKLYRPVGTWSYWFWPTNSVLFVSILIAAVRIPDELLDLFDIDVSNLNRLYVQSFNATEMQEFMYSCFILIYMYSLRARIGNLSRPARPIL